MPLRRASAVVALLSLLGGEASAGAGGGDELSVAEFLKRRPPHVRVASARAVVDLDGKKADAFELGHFMLDFGVEGPEAVVRADGPVVIFVHGYNVSRERALRSGLAIDAHLQSADRLLRPTTSGRAARPPIPLFLFLWRGDLGPTHFGDAQSAADLSAPSLAALIRQLHGAGADIVLLAHSLGARVALEALGEVGRAADGSALVSSLLLVQAAVPSTSIYSWTAKDFLSTSAPVERCRGRYAEAIRNADQVVYTVAEYDAVLANIFATAEWWDPYDRACFLPFLNDAYKFPFKSGALRALALGTPFDYDSVLECIPKLPLPVEDESRLSTRILRGYEPRDLPQLGTAEFEACYRFEFTLDHPKAERLDISTLVGPKVVPADWHSPIFERSGAPIIEQLWLRTMALKP